VRFSGEQLGKTKDVPPEDIIARKLVHFAVVSNLSEPPSTLFPPEEKVWNLEAMKAESVFLRDRRFTTNQFVFVTSPLWLTTSNFIFQLNT
jgi:hypothetical protein